MDEVAVWEGHRSEIERLYLRENITLNQLMKVMRIEYRFRKTANQYHKQFQKWNFKKRHGQIIWKYVEHQLRKRGERETDVLIDDQLQSPSKVQREIRRQGYRLTIDRFRTASSPEAPPGVVVCSPQPKMKRLQLTSNLPWIQFSRGYKFSLYPASACQLGILDVTTSLSETTKHMFPHIHQELTHALKSDFLDFIGLWKPCKDLALSEAGEALIEYDIKQFLQFTMFLLSNKLPIHVQIKSLDRRKWLAEEDIRIMRLVEVLELSNGFIFQHLLSTTQSSAQAILERIFQSAIRLQDFKIIEIMLQAGISPDLPIVSCESGKELLVSPLEVAASIENRSVSLRLTRLLLSFQANIHQFKSKPALQICIEMMGDYSNPNRELPTELSAERENLELLRLLLKSNPDLETRFRGFGARGPKVTALGLAVTLGQLQAVKVLIEHRANIYAAQQTYLDSDYPKFKTDLLGLASKRGDMAMMRMLFDISSNQRSQTTLCYKLIESLILAVTFSHEEATKLLLTAGVAVQAADNFLMARDASHKTLVERALAQQSRRLHLTLLSAGAVPVDRQAVIDSYSFDLLRSIKANDVRVVTDMLSWGAPPDDVYDDFPDSALGAAIAQGSCELIKLLKIAGATAEDLRIPCIPDMETVCCLTEIGFLPTILINSGQMILTCAILKAKDDKLINHLLSCGVDQQEMRLGFPESFEYWLDNLGLPECRTPLEAALSRRNMALAQVLIRRGARVSENELNAIVWQAVITDDEIIVPQFLAMFSTPFQAPTAMGMAVLWGRRDIFLALLEFGIDPKGYVFITDPPDEDEEVTSHNSGWWHLEPEGIMSSVLQVAASKGDRCTLQLFLNSANWSEEDKGRALTASIFWRNYHIVSDLSEAGASVNQGILETFALSDRVNTEMLPLQLAVNANNIDMVKYLLAMGAKINQLEAGVGGKTPLQVAAKNGNAELLTLLLDHGADVNHPPATNMGATALQFAASEGQIEIVCHLLDIGADVNAPRSQIFGRTAMEGAAERGHLDILQLIINNGAQTDGLGRGQLIRSVKLAENNGHFATARLLKSTCGWSEADKARCSLERFDEQEHLR